MNQECIRVGLVSYGYMGKVHSMCYRELPFYYNLKRTVQLAGIATPSKDSQRRAFQEAGFEQVFSDPEELINRNDIDVVDICAPTYLHEQYACAAAQAGKSLYIEKPLAHNLVSARRIYQAVTAAGIATGMAFEYRFIPALIMAKQLLDQNVIGTIVHFRAIYQGAEHMSSTKMKWQLDQERAGGGALFALGSHLIDLIRYLLGEYSSVYASEVKCASQGNVEQVVLMQVLMDVGARGSLEVSQVAAGSNIDVRIELYGTKGTICFNNKYPDVLKLYEVPLNYQDTRMGFREIQTMQQYTDSIFPPHRIGINWFRYHLASQYRFIKALSDNITVSPPTVYDGLKCQEVMEAAVQSISKGHPVFIDDVREIKAE